MIIPARNFTPLIGKDVFVAEGARIIGDVRIGDKASIWFNTTLRGDVMPITVGDETNIQDGTTVHGTYNKAAAVIGKRVTIGHNVVLHGCQVDDFCLIGMGSILMDDVHISERSIVAAGSLVTEGSKFKCLENSE